MSCGDIRKGIRTFLQQLQSMPPEIVLINYSGHATQIEGTVYLIPWDASPSSNPNTDFLKLEEVFQLCRDYLDRPARERPSDPKPVRFVLVVDACRGRAATRRSNATLSSSLEPHFDIAPKLWAVLFSCSRGTSARDGPRGGYSPFMTKLLDETEGIFAAGMPLKSGLEKACQRMRDDAQTRQAPMSVGLHNIKEDWCFHPVPPVTEPEAGEREREREREKRTCNSRKKSQGCGMRWG